VALNQYIQTIGQLGPEVLALGTKLENLPAFVGEKLGIDQDLLRDEAERQEMQEQAAQAAQQQQEAAAIGGA
jgi:hypothetical protein